MARLFRYNIVQTIEIEEFAFEAIVSQNPVLDPQDELVYGGFSTLRRWFSPLDSKLEDYLINRIFGERPERSELLVDLREGIAYLVRIEELEERAITSLIQYGIATRELLEGLADPFIRFAQFQPIPDFIMYYFDVTDRVDYLYVLEA